MEDQNKYSSGSLLKKISCKGRTIRIENLDVETAERINRTKNWPINRVSTV